MRRVRLLVLLYQAPEAVFELLIEFLTGQRTTWPKRRNGFTSAERESLKAIETEAGRGRELVRRERPKTAEQDDGINDA